MRNNQQHRKNLSRTEKGDYLSTIISALTPIYRAANAFSSLTVAHLPGGFMHLITVAPLLQNYLHQSNANELEKAILLQKEINESLSLLPSDVQEHYKKTCALRNKIDYSILHTL